MDDEAAPAEQLEPAERGTSRRTRVVAAAVILANLTATSLFLSGWTPTRTRSPSRSPATTAASVKQRAPVATVPRRNVALDLFSNECGVCHTLAAAGTTGKAGPNLDKLRPTMARVLAAIRDGGRGSGLMPANSLTGSDAARVARFVARAARR